jgi:ribosome-associated translation inhibitor RaiA/cold shock CspA family protein
MQVPIEIAFHNIQSSEWAEREIRSRIDKMERLFDRIVACRVRVDQRASSSKGAVPPVVRIEVSVPGYADIVVAHEPEHLTKKFQNPTLMNAINESFDLAERQLKEHKDKLTGRERAHAAHDAGHQFLAQIAEMHAEQDHGFLLTKEGGLLYFHRNSVLSGDFDALKRGQDVHYVEDIGDTGPIATKVRVKAVVPPA